MPDQNEVTPAPEVSPAAAQQAPIFQIQKIYLKDALFEQPNSPRIFKTQVQPNVNVSISTDSEKIEDGIYEVTIKGSIKGLAGEEILFFVEIEQAGMFELRNLPENQIEPTLSITCPGIIFPSLRYNLADMLNRAGFQPINLTEISFRALYEQRLAEEAKAAADAAAASTPAPAAVAPPPPAAPTPSTPPAPVMQEGMEVVVEDGRVVVKPAAQ